MQIERQIDIFAGDRRHLFQQAHHPPVVIHFDLLVAGGTVQLLFVIAFNTLFADIMVGGIILGFAIFCQPLQVVIVNFRDVANNVRQLGAVGIVALLVVLHGYAGEMEFVHRKARHFDIAQRGF